MCDEIEDGELNSDLEDDADEYRENLINENLISKNDCKKSPSIESGELDDQENPYDEEDVSTLLLFINNDNINNQIPVCF